MRRFFPKPVHSANKDDIKPFQRRSIYNVLLLRFQRIMENIKP